MLLNAGTSGPAMAGCITRKNLVLRGLLVFLVLFGDLVYAEGASGKKAALLPAVLSQTLDSFRDSLRLTTG